MTFGVGLSAFRAEMAVDIIWTSGTEGCGVVGGWPPQICVFEYLVLNQVDLVEPLESLPGES